LLHDAAFAIQLDRPAGCGFGDAEQATACVHDADPLSSEVSSSWNGSKLVASVPGGGFVATSQPATGPGEVQSVGRNVGAAIAEDAATASAAVQSKRKVIFTNDLPSEYRKPRR
jgi:hypothetical protein